MNTYFNKLVFVVLLSSVGLAHGAESTTHTFDDWSVNCSKQDGKTKKICVMNQSGIDNKTGRTVFQLIFNKPDANKIKLEVLVPLGVDLQSGINLDVDEKPSLSMKFKTCINQGCIAGQQISKSQERLFAKGKKGTVNIKDLAGKAINLPFSLKGFSKSVSKLKSMK